MQTGNDTTTTTTRRARRGTAATRSLAALGALVCLGNVAMAPAPTPEGLGLVPGDGEVALAWQQQLGADGIEIRRDGALLAQLPGGATSFRDGTSVNGQLHEYEVSAIIDGSATTVAEALGTTSVDGSLPAPAALLFGQALDGGLAITYGATVAGGDGQLSYRVYVDGELAGVRTGGVAAGELSLTGLVNGVEHLVEVEVIDRLGNRSPRRGISIVPRDLEPPAIPIDVTVDACQDGRVTLSWEVLGGAGGDAAVRYQVRQGDEVVAVVDDATATIDGLRPGVPATYTVVAMDGSAAATANHSDESAPVTVVQTSSGLRASVRTSATTPFSADDLAVEPIGDCMVGTPSPSTELAAPSMRLVGSAIEQDTTDGAAVRFRMDPEQMDELAGYRLFVDGRLARTGQPTDRPVAVRMAAGTRHVEAEYVDRHGRTSARTRLTVAPSVWQPLATPTGITAEPTTTGAELAWDAVAGAAGYRVDVDGRTVATVTTPSFSLRVPTARVASVRVTAFDVHGRTSITSGPTLVRARVAA